MRLPSEQLASHLQREFRPLYTVFGNEPLLALEAGVVSDVGKSWKDFWEMMRWNLA